MRYTYALTMNGQPTQKKLHTTKERRIGSTVIIKASNGADVEYKVIKEIKIS